MLPSTLPRLKGARIKLRSMNSSDACALLGIYGDPVVMRYTDEEPFDGLETVSIMLESVHALLVKGESLEWAVVLDGSDIVIGTCGLHSFNEPLHAAEVGCLLRQSAWGNGYMRETLNLLIPYAREVLGLRLLIADIDSDNHRAQRLFEKLGFQRAEPELWRMVLDGDRAD